MRSILKQTSMDSVTPSITFNDYCDERIQIMKNSANEYAKFLTQLDDLITRIDLTMETTRCPFKRKTVCFAEHNKVFLIPPWEIPSRQTLNVPDFDVQNLQNLFPNLFYWIPLKTPILNQLHSLPMTCSDIPPPWQTFDMSTNYSLVEDISETITQPLYFFGKWLNNRKKSQKDNNNKNRMNSVFFVSLLKQPLKRLAQADLTQSYNQSSIYEKKEIIAINIGWDYLHLWYHLICLPFLLPFNDQDDHLFYPRLFPIHCLTLILRPLKPWLALFITLLSLKKMTLTRAPCCLLTILVVQDVNNIYIIPTTLMITAIQSSFQELLLWSVNDAAFTVTLC